MNRIALSDGHAQILPLKTLADGGKRIQETARFPKAILQYPGPADQQRPESNLFPTSGHQAGEASAFSKDLPKMADFWQIRRNSADSGRILLLRHLISNSLKVSAFP